MPNYFRHVLLLLAGLVIAQAGLLAYSSFSERTPERVQVQPGRLAEAELRGRAPVLLSRVQTLLPPQRLSALVPRSGCAVVVFFSSSCPGLRPFAEQWRGLSGIPTASGIAPVSWVATFPTDSLAADSARAVGGVDRVLWFTHSDDASIRGVLEVPAAWILDDSLRVFGVTTDTTMAREALQECWRIQR